MVKRIFNIPKNNSFFLFGAKGTGKTHLLRKEFADENVLFIDLLDDEILWRYSRNPGMLISEYIQHQQKHTVLRKISLVEVS